MDFIEFPGVNVRIAEDQPEYQTLPAQIGVLPVLDADGSKVVAPPSRGPCTDLTTTIRFQLSEQWSIVDSPSTFGLTIAKCKEASFFKDGMHCRRSAFPALCRKSCTFIMADVDVTRKPDMSFGLTKSAWSYREFGKFLDEAAKASSP